MGSWSLNGNHDMYSGGWAYFDHLLAEPRFSTQRSPDGKGDELLPAVDTVVGDRRPRHGVGSGPAGHGPPGRARGPAGATYVTQVAAGLGAKKLLLLSHHQLVSVYSPGDLGKVLPRKLATVLADEQVTAWYWGHEHRCMAFEAAGGVRYPRCLGHGGVPVLAHRRTRRSRRPACGRSVPTSPGAKHWARFGFAVLDFDGPQISVRYRNELGVDTHPETIQ